MTNNNKANNKDKPFVALIDLHHQQRKEQQPNSQNGMNRKQKFSIIELNDPCNGIEKRQYLTTNTELGSNKKTSTSTSTDVYEIQSLPHAKSNNYSSFFIGSRVVSNPCLHLVSRIDPLFLLLTYFQPLSLPEPESQNVQCQTHREQKWQPWNQICQSRNIDSNIQQAIQENKLQLRHLFQVNDSLVTSDDDNNEDMILYKFQSELALKWLRAKVHNVQSMLEKQFKLYQHHDQRIKEEEKAMNGNSDGAFSSSFVLPEAISSSQSSNNTTTTDTESIDNEGKTSNDDDDDDNKKEDDDNVVRLTPSITVEMTKEEEIQILKSSIQIICEYLSPSWQTKLVSFLDMDINHVLKTKTASSQSRKEKKASSSNSSPSGENNRLASTITPASSSSSLSPQSAMPTQHSSMSESDKLLQYTMGGGGSGSGGTNGDNKDNPKDKNKISQRAKTVGLVKLQKVNTKGMKSLSSFFGPVSGGSKKKKARLN
jgi:hypothetical protein